MSTSGEYSVVEDLYDIALRGREVQIDIRDERTRLSDELAVHVHGCRRPVQLGAGYHADLFEGIRPGPGEVEHGTLVEPQSADTTPRRELSIGERQCLAHCHGQRIRRVRGRACHRRTEVGEGRRIHATGVGG